jgi:hypothetical protein
MTQVARIGFFSIAVAILFLVSWGFPIGACLASDISRLPNWWGAADVAEAFVLAFAAFGLQMLIRERVDRRAEDAVYRVYRVLTHGIILLAVVVMLAGDRIRWGSCATGFMWRTWLGLYLLPWWLMAIRGSGSR